MCTFGGLNVYLHVSLVMEYKHPSFLCGVMVHGVVVYCSGVCTCVVGYRLVGSSYKRVFLLSSCFSLGIWPRG